MGCHALLQVDLPDLGTEPAFPEAPALQADSLPLNHGEALSEITPVKQERSWSIHSKGS